MGLMKPEADKLTGPGIVTGKKRFIKYTLLLLAMMIVIVGVITFYKQHHRRLVTITNTGITNADDSVIKDYKNSSDLDEKRSLISAYYEKGDYASALPVAKQVADTTRTYQDYMSVLSICALHNVLTKEPCINDIVGKLKPLIADIPFTTAYGAGGMLEKNNRKNDAADFYQRAYDVYDVSAGGDNLMSKDKLISHINELRK